MPDRSGPLGGYRDYAIRYQDMINEEACKVSRKRQEQEAAAIRNKYARILELIPYYPDTTTPEVIKKKLQITNCGLITALSSLDKAGCLLIQEKGILSRLKEDLSNVY